MTVRGVSPLRDFLRTEAAGGVLLAVGAAAALVWANSPWRGSYESFWTADAAIRVAGHTLQLDVRHWVNDGLMTIFFLVVGLEIKRELVDGHLSSRRTATLPIAAALGGMVVPALLYLAIAGGSAASGWAIPTATDIALALGVVAVAGPAVAPPQRAFLLGLAIVDDIGAIVVIAIAYSTGVSAAWLALAAGALLAAPILQRVGVHATLPYVAIVAVAWLGLHEGGVHATLAGVAMGLLAPTTPHTPPDLVDVEELLDLSSVEHARATTDIARRSVSVVEWLEHVLHPWTSFVVVPVFALANAGIEVSIDALGDAVTSPISWAVFAGLVLGKPIGITIARHLAARAGWADDDAGATSRSSIGVGLAAGIGFTVALFVTELAFDDPAHRADAKLAVLVASAVAAGVSLAVLGRRRVSSA